MKKEKEIMQESVSYFPTNATFLSNFYCSHGNLSHKIYLHVILQVTLQVIFLPIPYNELLQTRGLL